MYARTRRFSVGLPRNISVLSDGRVLFLRSRDGDDPVLCLWLVAPNGQEEIVVDPAELPELGDGELPLAELARRERARESAAGIVGYAVDHDGTRACFTIGGSLFVVDLATGELSEPTIAGPVFDPRLSPDGRLVAYVSGNDLRLVDLASPDSDRGLTAAGAGPVSYGRAEFIAAEEMQRSRGYWWSPSSDRLLITRVDEAPVSRWWIADPAHPDRPPNEVRYPATGSANAQVELLLVDLDGHQRAIRWDEDGRFEYLAGVVWTAGHDPLIVRQTRDQREVSIATLDPDNLQLSERRVVTDDTWVELIPSSPTPCERGLLTIEDLAPLAGVTDVAEPGRRALLLDGRALTGAELNVRSIIGVVGDSVVCSAWTSPSEIHLVLIDLTGSADPLQLTTVPGVHAAVLGGVGSNGDGGDGSGDGDQPLLAVTSARPATDGVEVAVRPLASGDTADADRPATRGLGAPVAFIEDVSRRPPIKAVPIFCQLGADRLESALFLPSNYDGTGPLPVLLDPYGGPHTQRVLKTQTAHLVSQWFAEQGFAVLVVDGRGTPGRGPEWERQVWGDLATPVLEDQLAALDAAADEFSVLDLDRVAIRGWSFGGYLAALAVLRRPDRFHAAVAGAPVTTWRLYDTHYTERYLGRPDLHPRHYDTTDLTAEAAKLTRPLLLIHGLADDNVVAAHTLRLSTALLAEAVPHRVLPLSGVTHMTPQEAVAENLLWLQLDFIREALGLGRSVPSPSAPSMVGSGGRP